MPVWAHLPMIHGPDGCEAVEAAMAPRRLASSPTWATCPRPCATICAKLGWGHGDDEIFTDAQAQGWFDIKDVVGAPARLDWAKLNHLNNHYIRLAEPARLTALVAEIHKSRDFAVARWRPRPDRTCHPARCATARRPPWNSPTPRCSRSSGARWSCRRRRAGDLLCSEETCARLGRLRARRLLTPRNGTVPALEAHNRAFAEREGVGLGKIGPALRMVLTGGSSAIDLAGALVALGKDESLGRIEDALSLNG